VKSTLITTSQYIIYSKLNYQLFNNIFNNRVSKGVGKLTCISANRRSEMCIKRSRKPIMVIFRKAQISTAKIDCLCVATREVYGYVHNQ
jgi:hypothetical protein